jgi:SAM-dependent methyltransferase
MTANPQSERTCPICRSQHIQLWGSAPDIGVPGRKHEIVRCGQCTHLFVWPLPDEESLVKAYSKGDPSFFSNNRFYESRSNRPFNEADRWVWRQATKSLFKGNFLDIGSANFNLLQQIVELGWRLTIVEPGSHAEHIRDRLQAKVYRNVFEKCDFENRFDFISAIDVLEHVKSPLLFLQKLRSSLSDRGIALLRFPNSGSLRCRMEHENWNMIRPLGHLHYFSPRSTRTACERAHLKIVSLRSYDLARYQFLNFKGKAVRGVRFLWPILRLMDLANLGDQLLLEVKNA